MVTRTQMAAYFPHGDLRHRIVALPDRGCVYVKNLKAGCSTVTLWLHRIHTGDHDFVPDTERHAEFKTPRPRAIGWRRVARMLSGEAYRFTFVRDPLRRAESAYRDKIVATESEFFRDRIRDTLELPAGTEVTLDTFVEALVAGDHLTMDPHWRPQHLNLMHPLLTYDFVGRLENFTVDLAQVREACGLPEVAAPIRNATSRESLFDSRPDLARRVREVYAGDYELYGY